MPLSVSNVEVLERSMEGRLCIISCTLTVGNEEILTHVLIDCRAPGISVMDEDFCSPSSDTTQSIERAMTSQENWWMAYCLSQYSTSCQRWDGNSTSQGTDTYVHYTARTVSNHPWNAFVTATWCPSSICFQFRYVWIPIGHYARP